MRGEWNVSIRRACRVLLFDTSSYHYKSRRPGQAVLEQRIKEICQTRVRYGYRRVHVLLRREANDGAALLPLTALHQRDGKPAVWVYDPATQKVNLRAVEIGPYREDGVVIRGGLRAGEFVVTAGVHKLTDGQTVRPYEGAPAAQDASKASPVAPAPTPRKSVGAVPVQAALRP